MRSAQFTPLQASDRVYHYFRQLLRAQCKLPYLWARYRPSDLNSRFDSFDQQLLDELGRVVFQHADRRLVSKHRRRLNQADATRAVRRRAAIGHAVRLQTFFARHTSLYSFLHFVSSYENRKHIIIQMVSRCHERAEMVVRAATV